MPTTRARADRLPAFPEIGSEPFNVPLSELELSWGAQKGIERAVKPATLNAGAPSHDTSAAARRSRGGKSCAR